MWKEEERKKKKKKKRKKNNAKFSGHYVWPRMENVRAHALRSQQKYICLSTNYFISILQEIYEHV